MNDTVLSPSEFVALLNQTLEAAYPLVVIEGELSEYRISKNRWVYFKVKDDEAVVDGFSSVYQLKAPLEDGMMIRVVGRPRLHPRFGFSVTAESIQPVGEGSIRRAFQMLQAKLEKEGLFAPERKRPLPEYPVHIGLISSAQAAGAEDFLKVLSERWPLAEVQLADVAVQGESAPEQIIRALNYFNEQDTTSQMLVLVRGGGSQEDLSAFNDEQVVRAVAGSRLPIVVGVGHEQDVSLADMAADVRAATPTQAAVLIAPDAKQLSAELDAAAKGLSRTVQSLVSELTFDYRRRLELAVGAMISELKGRNESFQHTLKAYDPLAVLKRGYSLIRKKGQVITTVKQVKPADELDAQLSDGIIQMEVKNVQVES